MPERRRRPDLDEPFTLAPMEGEEVLRHLLGTEEESTEEPEGEPEKP